MLLQCSVVLNRTPLPRVPALAGAGRDPALLAESSRWLLATSNVVCGFHVGSIMIAAAAELGPVLPETVPLRFREHL